MHTMSDIHTAVQGVSAPGRMRFEVENLTAREKKWLLDEFYRAVDALRTARLDPDEGGTQK